MGGRNGDAWDHAREREGWIAALAMATAAGGLSVVAATSVTAAPPAPAAPESTGWSASDSGPDTMLVSASAAGVPGDRAGDRPMISGNGRYVTFDSASTNLVPGVDTWGVRVYRKDLETGAIEVVSQSDDDRVTNEWSSFSWPDDSGNLVSFVSDDQGLTTPATRSRSIFVRNLSAGTTELISVGLNGAPNNGASSRGVLSSDGRYAAFSSFATNLTTSGGNGQEQVYLRDRVAGTTTLISVAATGGLGDARSYRGMVSTDGRYVAFASKATNLTPGTNPATESIFLRDLVAGTTTRVTVRQPSGTPSPIGGARPYLTPDGAVLAFNSHDGLLPDDTNGKSDVYLYNVATGALERQSAAHDGGNGDDDALRGFISDDHRYTVYNSFSTNLVPDDTNYKGDAFLRDRETGQNLVLSRSFSMGGADAQSFRPVLDDDASVVTYLSEARNLVRGDTAEGYQVYAVHTASLQTVQPDTTAPTLEVTSPSGNPTMPGPDVTISGTAADDRAVGKVFVQLRDNDTNQWLRPDGTWGTGARRLSATLDVPEGTATGWSLPLSLPDGSYGFDVVSQDTSGNTSDKPWRRFTLSSATPDTTPPALEVTSPTGNPTMPGPAVTITGTATDDRAVAGVFVQVRDNDTNQWLRPDGTWGTGARRLTATVASPGSTSTGWSLPLSLPDGSYGFDSEAVDAAGNGSPKPWHRFTLSSATPDTVAPEVAVTAPTGNQTVPGPAVTITGTATDDRGVSTVYVQVRNNTTNQWLRPDGTWGSGARRITATLASPGATSSAWSLPLSLPAAPYGFDVQSVDAAGNVSTKPWHRFVVNGS